MDGDRELTGMYLQRVSPTLLTSLFSAGSRQSQQVSLSSPTSIDQFHRALVDHGAGAQGAGDADQQGAADGYQ